MTATSAIRQKRTLLCNAWCDRMHDGGRICNLECRVDAGQGFFCGHGWLLQVGERYSREVQQRRLVGRLPHLQESIRAGRLSGPVHPQEPRLLARAARSPTAGSAGWLGASRRWCQSGAGPAGAPRRPDAGCGPDFDAARPAAPTASVSVRCACPGRADGSSYSDRCRPEALGRGPPDDIARPGYPASAEPWCSAVRPIPRVSSETWTLRSVPSADVSRSSRSYVGG
jgi:hypothetical protein